MYTDFTDNMSLCMYVWIILILLYIVVDMHSIMNLLLVLNMFMTFLFKYTLSNCA